MKGQFFIVATVIMVITLMALVRYFYGFSGINLQGIKEKSELNYIPFINDSLNEVLDSFNGDCDKLRTDLEYTKKFLENSMIKRGMNLDIEYSFSCPPPTASFDFMIKSSDIYIETKDYSGGSDCSDNSCDAGDYCPSYSIYCDDNMCYEPTCFNGCGQTLVPNGGTDEACGSSGCDNPPCECDGFGNCVETSSPPPPP
jgi:hypothetical protein